MALPTNTQTSYDSVGNREDLINKIYMVEQTMTPFCSKIAKVTATATKHEWQTDDLASAVDTNAVLEGDDATTDAAIATTRLHNYTQISDKVARVTGTQESVDHAGRSSEMAYQRAKKMTELKRDIEKSALANKAAAVGSNSVARVSAGIESWITNDSFGATGASPTGDGTNTRTDGNQRAFTEAMLKTVLASSADAGANPDLVLVGSFNKQAMSAFTGNNITRNVDSSKAELQTSIDIYVSDFGRLEIVYSPFSRSRSALIVDTNLWAMATLPGRAFMSKPLAKTGDSERTQVLTEWTLEARNESGNGIIADLTVA